MMISEFIDRTGYEPSMEEYHHIEESYYDFPGNKDEFCKQWKKDWKDGHWAKELKLRQQMEAMEEAHKNQVAELDDTLNFYRPYFQKTIDLKEELREANEKLERIQRVCKRVFGED